MIIIVYFPVCYVQNYNDDGFSLELYFSAELREWH